MSTVKPKTVQDLIDEAMGSKSVDDFSREYSAKYGSDDADFNEEKKVGKKKLKGKKMRSRRIIKLLFSKCPMCHLKLAKDIPELIDLKTLGNKFVMLQFASNPDNTGFESYWCGFCKKFYMMLISPRLIAMDPQMKM